MRVRVAMVACMLLLSGKAFAQTDFSYLALGLMPGALIPLGDSDARFDTGLFTALSAAYKPPIGFPLHMQLVAGYDLVPVASERVSPLSVLSIGGGLALRGPILGRITAAAFADVGYYYGVLSDTDGREIGGGNPFWDAGAEIGFLVSPAIHLSVGGFYRAYTGLARDLAVTAVAYAGVSYRIALSGDPGYGNTGITGQRPAKAKIVSIDVPGILPVFYQYYDDHPLGRIVIRNDEPSGITGIRASIFVKEYMDAPKASSIPQDVPRRETVEVPLYALFTRNVLDITEGTKANAEIVVEYEVKGETRRIIRNETLRFESRNASIWDDDRRIAAFVTAKDPAVLRFSKNIASILRDEKEPTIDANLSMAVAIHGALARYGLVYTVDPATPYASRHRGGATIDFLQFPRQTLDFKAGDCDDLSILYAALLESLGIRTAFITVPGHIYVAVALASEAGDVLRLVSSQDSLISRADGLWLPIEVTMITDGFLSAWAAGAKQWREAQSMGQAGFYPVREAWSSFEPVGLPGEGAERPLPEAADIQAVFRSELRAIMAAEMAIREKDLLDRIKTGGESPRLLNQLGILYARYGFYDKARSSLSKATASKPYAPALVNLGNLALIRGDNAAALEAFMKADKAEAGLPSVAYGLALAYRALGRAADADRQLERLRGLSPTLYQTARLDQGSTTERASRESSQEAFVWQE